jgi:exodeoxyribonuclease VII small subunit
MSQASAPDAEQEELRFEEALERLDELVASLEGGDLDLEDSLASFEQGVRLVRLCTERLKSAELRVKQLEDGSDGPEERPLELEDDA